MISVDMRGRMGNQMFQLAFAHAASRRLDTTFTLGPDDLGTGFSIGPWASRTVRLARKLEFRLRYGADPAAKVEVPDDADPAQVLAELRDGVAYGGFFQSERFFAGFEDEVRALFEVRREHRRAFEAKYGRLGSYVCVHVRRGDYLAWEGGRALPTSYFQDALATIGDLDRHQVVVISDDPATVARDLADIPRVRFEANPPMIDFQLLTNAAAVVASPSSFSWWGAWLNVHQSPRIVVPRHWFGFPQGRERPRDVIPERWHAIAVRDAAFGT